MTRFVSFLLSVFFVIAGIVASADAQTTPRIFQVKDADVYYGDSQEVLISLRFFDVQKLNLIVPADGLTIHVDGGRGTRLVAVYEDDCKQHPSVGAPCGGYVVRRITKATLFVSHESTATEWRARIDQVRREHEDLRGKDVIPNIQSID